MYKTCKIKATMLKSSRKKIGKLTQRPEIKVYLAHHCTYTHFKKYLTQDQIIQYVQDGHLFGFFECDIEVSGHLRDHFSEMTPIFKNVDVCLDDIIHAELC